MKKSLKTIEQISNIALLFMFVFFVLSFWFEALNFLSSACICIVYVCTFLRVRIRTNKSYWPLFILCVVTIGWMFINMCFSFTYGSVISNIFIYLYLNLTAKISSGKWNKYLVLVGVFGVSGHLINILFDIVWIVLVTVLLQVFALMKYIDPLLERIALEKRAKRLGVDYETVAAEYHKKPVS